MPNIHTRSDFQLLEKELDPILLELGASLYVCQGFEQTLIFLLAIVEMENAEMAEGSLASAIDSLSQRTLGQLLKRLHQKLDITTELDSAFEAAWTARNWIAHEFLHDTAVSMRDQEGRQKIRNRLMKSKLTVKRGDHLAIKLLDEYISQFGPAIEDMRTSAEHLWHKLHPSPRN